jgi:hypothetical protein
VRERLLKTQKPAALQKVKSRSDSLRPTSRQGAPRQKGHSDGGGRRWTEGCRSAALLVRVHSSHNVPGLVLVRTLDCSGGSGLCVRRLSAILGGFVQS